MSQNSQMYFELALKRLEKAYQDLKKNHIEFKESEKINFLKELVKEQLKNEDSHTPAR
ncbi:MAG: hypothetical protein ACK5Y2_09860 [Bdellovibrionales bacterium]